ncbi:Uncharacterised protein [Sphingobacterium spiritivorum]|uniref:KTSC domain-containing protein n=1 Tax=Sphingobacterium spiritivorum ATCC 33861 TaxID=525373 RepID=D7VNC1_SPHSI|nr:hypothetical protein HMPREF0766_12491 [Sphingobacterium spiritivorum ATCC 33861]SUJ21445.1 Uncharacterised protein [Sphingobacterium spiritivorum]
MERYANRNGDSGIFGYEIGSNFILIQFTTGSVYEYTYASAGMNHIENMKSLALSGSGLNSYIMKNVRTKYSRKIR